MVQSFTSPAGRAANRGAAGMYELPVGKPLHLISRIEGDEMATEFNTARGTYLAGLLSLLLRNRNRAHYG
jgi:hypothetical protein